MVKISVIYNTIRPGGVDILYNNLIKQTFEDFEVIFLDAWNIDREVEVKKALSVFDLKYLKGLPKKENDVWTLNKDYNLALKNCTGELIVFLQDYLWIPPNTLQEFWDTYQENPNALQSAVGNKAKEPDVATDINGKITIFGSNYDGVPQGISEADDRFDGKSEVLVSDWTRWEMNLACAPKKILDKIGGFEEDMDTVYSGDNYVLAAKAWFLGGAKFLLNKNIRMIGFNQSAFFPRPELWEEKHANKGYLGTKIDQIFNGIPA